ASVRAYVGLQQTTVAPSDSIIDNRIWLDMPPPGTQCSPSCGPASNPAQKPRNGPNENGKKTRSAGLTRAPRYTVFQHSSNHCQLSLVSIQRNGRPVDDDVWQ